MTFKNSGLMDPPHGGAVEPLHRPTGAGIRKKGASVRTWLIVDTTGQTQAVEAEKHEIMKRTGLPARDLRILDPVLSYPSTVLGRERAIVVNLEHIKAIITSNEVLFLNSTDPLVTPFIKKLQGIFRCRETPQCNVFKEDKVDSDHGDLYDSEEQHHAVVSHHQFDKSNKNEEGNADGEHQVGENPHSLKRLPFEFVALETCLEAACKSLDSEARTLEQEAHPALDKLTSKISTLNLERVRQIKSRLVAITGRVQKVRDELEHLLDDDDDMAEMYLTHKFEEQLEKSSDSSVGELDDTDREVLLPDAEHSGFDDVPEADNENIGERNSFRRDSHRTHTSTHSVGKNFDVEELEMILEAYFVQIEGSLNKLSTLREYVDDTEDYINIMLDDKQNHLLQMGVMLTTATVVLSAFIALVGVFGMNVEIELFDENFAGMPDFMWTVWGGTIGCVVLYVAAIVWCKHKRLLE